MGLPTIPARTHSQGDLWRACCSLLARLSRVIQKICPRWAHRFAPPESMRASTLRGRTSPETLPATTSLSATFPTDFSKLPTVSWVIPNLDNDMHDGTIQQGDRWLQTNLMPYVTWAQNNSSLLVVQFDEDDGTSGNHIVTIFCGTDGQAREVQRKDQSLQCAAYDRRHVRTATLGQDRDR